MNNAIEIKDLSLSIEGRSILNNISFGLGEIDIACLLGPSGCGKTSLLRCIAGFEKLANGEVWIKGVIASNPNHHVPVEQRNIGMVFQDYVLFPHMSVSENIIFGLKNLKATRIKDRLDEKLGSRLSVFQELYRLDSSIMDDINDWNTYPELPKIITDENLIGYIIKFNVSESLYFKFNDKKPIIRLYEYKIIEANNFNTIDMTPIIVHDRKYYNPS